MCSRRSAFLRMRIWESILAHDRSGQGQWALRLIHCQWIHPRFASILCFFGLRTVNHQHLADVLHRCSVEASANFLQ
ncbi:MAG: hypothetical protein K0S36_24 [Nitrosospira multiformis]|nr:hypothetical protein [Nitrosospira multiformis]